MDLCDLPAYELTQMVRQRKTSAVDILESCLKRIEKVDGRPGSLEPGDPLPEDDQRVHAFITLTADRALTRAKIVDQMIAAGKDPGILAGIPFTVKDIFCVDGTPSTAASRILGNFKSPYTATAVSRMEEAGAVMLGKVNLALILLILQIIPRTRMGTDIQISRNS